VVARGRVAIVLVGGSLAGERIKNATLKRERREFGELNVVLESNLRCPAPEISGVGERRRSERSQRSWRQRREEKMILARDQGSILPIHSDCPSAQADNA